MRIFKTRDCGRFARKERIGDALLCEAIERADRGIVDQEIVEDHDGDTYRAVYIVKLAQAVYVLHAFQKKSKRGIATPPADIDLIKRRLAEAVADAKKE